jgi:prepilin-type N-terminal cleavage/methylation domain-containing protein/prepilin-type processing-associated H-X9-DG protein
MRTKRNGFTLVELLVVIGIIGLLVSILLPALQSARRHAELVSCLSNVRQVSNAFYLYGYDYHGSLPGPLAKGVQPMYARYDPAGNAEITLPSLLARYLGVSVNRVPLNTFVLNKVFRCPAWNALRDFPDSMYNLGNSPAGMAYAYDVYPWEPNISIKVGAGASATYLKPFGVFGTAAASYTDRVAPMKLSSIKRSSECWAMCEYDSVIGAVSGHTFYSGPQYAAKPVHQKYWNVLYFDGHAVSVPLNAPPTDPIY